LRRTGNASVVVGEGRKEGRLQTFINSSGPVFCCDNTPPTRGHSQVCLKEHFSTLPSSRLIIHHGKLSTAIYRSLSQPGKNRCSSKVRTFPSLGTSVHSRSAGNTLCSMLYRFLYSINDFSPSVMTFNTNNSGMKGSCRNAVAGVNSILILNAISFDSASCHNVWWSQRVFLSRI